MNTMLAQIKSLPKLADEIYPYLNETVRQVFDHELCLSVKRLFLVGCGDSHHVALNTEYAFEALAGLPTEPMTAMQYARYGAGFMPSTGPLTNLLIGISVSGAVARTAEALRMGRQLGAVTIALTATEGSRVTQEAERTFLAAATPFDEPPGTATPGVRSFFVNQLALLLSAVRFGEVRGRLTLSEAENWRAQIRNLSETVAWTIEQSEPHARELAEAWKDASEFVFVGSGPNFGTALFSAAKILEASGDSALGQDTEEWGHLQYFARAVETPTFFITACGRDYSRTVEAATAAKTIGRRVVAIAPNKAAELVGLSQRHLPIAEVPELLSPVVAAIPGELVAAYRSEVIGEPFFRGFGGGRSIEGGGGISRIRTSDTWEVWQP
ncbi:SIS domain-containing protein [Thermanaerothrix sp.]|jgi:glucosamine--fructose-6-phosphate aminotransferase (isomerizing)|uniref:SIS domain-containing protein n=1 Tax=Thermanaerothrix sp. TaxID=2972675 RepID=UPI002ADDDC76|nr:SIS domain-containing protein [Thermanaerothrix sp.]